MTTGERKSAYNAALAAITLSVAGDAVRRDRAMDDLWVVAGYWRTYRASPPLKMIRFPAGRSQPWHTHRVLAAQAWAAIA